MGVSQIGNGEFPLNNCAILRGVLEPNQIDFIQSFLRGDALRNPIAELAGGVKSAINDAVAGLQGIGSFVENPDGTFGDFIQTPWARNLQTAVESFQDGLVEFEQRTNRISGVVSGFQDGQPDLGRILGIGSAYNSALATLATDPEEIFKDNFSHGFNSLKQEFGINAIQESQNALDATIQFIGQFGAGDFDPGDLEFFDEALRISTQLEGIQQSFINIATAEDSFLSGALAFLDDFGLANTALSGLLTDPCMAGKVIADLVAGPGIEGLIPELQIPEPPSLEEIAGLIPDPEELVDSIKASVEGIVESVQQQAEQLIDSVVDQGKEAISKLEKTFEELQAQGERLIDQAEQAAADLATNISEFGQSVEEFFASEDDEAAEDAAEAIEDVPRNEDGTIDYSRVAPGAVSGGIGDEPPEFNVDTYLEQEEQRIQRREESRRRAELPDTDSMSEISRRFEEQNFDPRFDQSTGTPNRVGDIIAKIKSDLQSGLAGRGMVDPDYLAQEFVTRDLEALQRYVTAFPQDYADTINLPLIRSALNRQEQEIQRQREYEQQQTQERATAGQRASWIPVDYSGPAISITLTENTAGGETIYRAKFTDLVRQTLFFSESFNSEQERSTALSRLQEYTSQVLGRDISGRGNDNVQIGKLFNTNLPIRDIKPAEITELVKVYNRGSDLQSSASELRKVLTPDQINYYIRMTRNMISYGTTGIPNLNSIKNALEASLNL
jgi:ABC-type transporter Mla subunit MlaD